MATVKCFKVDPPAHDPIPPDGTFYFISGPFAGYGSGAITVTAHPRSLGPDPNGFPFDGVMYMEVAQVATRTEFVTNAPNNFYLDIVVRNNTHVNDSNATSINAFDVYISVIEP